MESAYDVLNSIRADVLGKYRNTQYHRRYQSIRRGLANAVEEARAGSYSHSYQVSEPDRALEDALALRAAMKGE